MESVWWILVGMSVIGLMMRLFPLVLGQEQLVRVVGDDAYYHLQLSRNIAQGKGSTFDGLTRTNSLHPIYNLLLAGLFRFFRDDPDRPLRAALIVLALASVLTAPVVFLIVNMIS